MHRVDITNKVIYMIALTAALAHHSHCSQTDSEQLPFNLWWFAPFLSGGGYCSEAISFITALAQRTELAKKLYITPFADSDNPVFYRGLDLKTQSTMKELFRSPRASARGHVVICHSEPGAWNPPLYSTTPCPPNKYDEAQYVIGRTMFETDRLTPEHVKRCNRMNEVWVPSEFHREVFAAAGVERSKLVKMPEPVDVEFFTPANEPLQLPQGQLVFGSARPQAASFSFLSIFKWEDRKGWDVLVRLACLSVNTAPGGGHHVH
ncbi:hypothetical protein CYMTET_17449 [Cymbomonas tetramitiformis]|uniref:Uncharacterized protein n=1 Tax=Cymbomonas tetramitiformis TaxID=36881 RepID=A0AAE0GA27_9CHLO|nr:hypothetical protein CYMTET_17449 [Cymbomonas tetramitiformis]